MTLLLPRDRVLSTAVLDAAPQLCAAVQNRDGDALRSLLGTLAPSDYHDDVSLFLVHDLNAVDVGHLLMALSRARASHREELCDCFMMSTVRLAWARADARAPLHPRVLALLQIVGLVYAPESIHEFAPVRDVRGLVRRVRCVDASDGWFQFFITVLPLVGEPLVDAVTDAIVDHPCIRTATAFARAARLTHMPVESNGTGWLQRATMRALECTTVTYPATARIETTLRSGKRRRTDEATREAWLDEVMHHVVAHLRESPHACTLVRDLLLVCILPAPTRFNLGVLGALAEALDRGLPYRPLRVRDFENVPRAAWRDSPVWVAARAAAVRADRLERVVDDAPGWHVARRW